MVSGTNVVSHGIRDECGITWYQGRMWYHVVSGTNVVSRGIRDECGITWYQWRMWYHVVSGTNGHNASLITQSQVEQYGGRHLIARSVASYGYRRKKQLPVNTVSTVHLAWKATIHRRAAKHKIQVLENLTRWQNPHGYTSHITYPSVILCSSGYKVRTTTRSLGHWKIWKVQQNSGPSKSTVATFSFEVSRLFVGRSRRSDSWMQGNAMRQFERRRSNVSRRRLPLVLRRLTQGAFIHM